MTIVGKIIKREIEAVIIYENKDVIAFLDHDPINHGHILICPKLPYKAFIDVPENIMIELLRVSRDIYKKLSDKYPTDGISFIQNNGSFNELSHYHLHIFPRFKGDGFGWTTSEIGIQSKDQLELSAVNL